MARPVPGAEPPGLTSLQLVPFRDVLDNAVQEAHAGLAQLAERLPSLPDEERKRQLLLHLQATRQRLQRLHVCAQWAHKAKAVNTCREVLKAAQDHGAALMHTADELFRVHEELRFGRAPLFDVSTALHITQTGTYRLLPRVVEDELMQPGQRLERPGELSEGQRAAKRRDALRRVDFLLRSKLLKTELPAGMRVARVRGGQASVAAAGGQYVAQLTLVPAPRDDVTLAKYRPPGELKDEPAAKAEHEEVTQPAAADGQPSTSAAAAAAGPSSSAAAASAASQDRQGPDCWRWQLLSFELLPAAAGHDPPPLEPAQRVWLQQHLEQRMWAAADVAQLASLGKEAWVTVPEPPGAGKDQQQQQGRASAGGAPLSSRPAPSGSLAPSHLAAGAAAAADEKGKQPVVVKEEQQSEQQGPADGHAQEAAGSQLPPYATCPLVAMHAILCQTAGRLAVFSLLLADARQLEGGSWKGSLKLSRAGTASGLRLSYWQQLPCCSYAELQCLREGRPYQPEAEAAAPGQQAAAAAAAAASQQQQVAPAVEVAVASDGGLAVASLPLLHHALSGEAVQLSLPLDRGSSFDADRLLLSAAAHSAAVQLAAVQAALQRAARLAPAGIHAELSLPATAADGTDSSSQAAAALPASPQLHLWSAGSLQLSLSVQLRSGRLLLVAGPGLLESEQGSSAAAAVAEVRQQLEQLQRDAMSQPLPAGSSRGMLAARLVADALSRLSLQLSMRQRMDAAAAAAVACGLQRAALPQQLLDQHARQAGAFAKPLSSSVLALALPPFPPPGDMQRWVRQQQRRRQGPAAGLTCAVRCFLLLDFGTSSGAAAAAAGAGDAAAATTGSGGAAGAAVPRSPQLPRMLLASCSCTARGTVTRIVQLAELPPHALADSQAAGRPASSAAASSRKRRASDAAADAGADAAEAASLAASAGADLDSGLAAAAAWGRRQAGLEALRAQLLLLPVPHTEEQPLGRLGQQIVRFPKVPSLAQLEAWAVAKLAAAAAAGGAGSPAKQPAPKPVASMQLDESEAGAGAWRVDLASAYFAHLPDLLGRQGLRLAAPAPDARHIRTHAGGLTLRYSLVQGHSVLTALSDLIRMGMLHSSLARLAGCMAANPLAPAASKARPDAAGGASYEGPSNGGLPNGQLLHGGASQADGAKGGSSGGGLVWPLPGCGSVELREAGLTHFVLLVAPPALPEGLQHLEQPPAVRLTVAWENALLGSAAGEDGSNSSGSHSGGAPAATAARPGAAAGGLGASAAAGGLPPSGASSSSGGGGSLRHIRCRIASEPPLPDPVVAALALQLEAGRADLFLDSLCLASHAAAAAATQLTPAAQRSAGLLPGALRLLGASPTAGGAAGGSGGGASALRLWAQLQQGARAASLSMGFHAGGYTLLQLAPASPFSSAAVAAAASWMGPLWERLPQSVPTFAAVQAPPAGSPPAGAEQARAPQQQQHVRQAWVHHSGLPQALAAIMQAVAAPAVAKSGQAVPAPEVIDLC